MIKEEAKTEHQAVRGAIKELEALQKVQREAAAVSGSPVWMDFNHTADHYCFAMNRLKSGHSRRLRRLRGPNTRLG